MFVMPPRRRIYLMRHGEAAYVSEDGEVTTEPTRVPLTSTGRAQAKTQGRVLADIRFDRAVCSGLPRTVETAQLVLGQSNHTLPDLEQVPQLEEIHGMRGPRAWPPDNGQTAAEVIADIANPWAHGAKPDATFLGGEPFKDFDARVTEQWERIIADEDWQTILLVLHGGVNRMLFNHMIGLDWRGDLCIEQDNCCINIVDVDATHPRRYLIRAVNITAYNLSKDGIVLTNMEATAKRVADTLSSL